VVRGISMLNEIAMGAFAAVHESESGANRTNRAGLLMSVIRGRPEIMGRRSKRRF
jgi:hypothetical protein